MPSLESPPPSMPGKEASGGAAIYTVGTLRYGQRELVWLFFWLMWNDFAIMLIESVNGVGQFIMRDQGATLMEIALVNSVGFFLPWLNPLVSTWSDRHRGRWGRRRPFLFGPRRPSRCSSRPIRTCRRSIIISCATPPLRRWKRTCR